jgi:hypothetical protein
MPLKVNIDLALSTFKAVPVEPAIPQNSVKNLKFG